MASSIQGSGMTEKRARVPLFLRSKMVLLGALCLVVPIMFAVTATFLSPYDPQAVNPAARLKPPAWQVGGTTLHLLGTDSLGRDVLSRLMHGARVSLLVGMTVVLLGGVLGSLIGLLSGYFGGALDAISMRLADVFLAFPFLLLALAIMAILGPGLWNVIMVLGVTSWVPYARVARAKVLAVKESEYVRAAHAIGVSEFRIIMRHVLPNTISSLVVLASFRVAAAIVGEATLSFLGLGVGPQTPTWGAMLSEGRLYIAMCWWLATLPGLMIVLGVLGCNLIGDGLRDVLDPKFQRN
jgi:peptide/nickel transport system permease protein